jgi:hypothetical protein
MIKEKKTGSEKNNIEISTIANLIIAGMAVVGIFFTGISSCATYNYLKEFKNQFAVGNEPILQIEPKFTNNDTNVFCTPALSNYGKAPVFIKMVKWGIMIKLDKTIPTIEEIKKTYPSDTYNTSIFLGNDKSNNIKTLQLNNGVNLMKQFPIYVCGIITYQNIITKELNDYIFEIKVSEDKGCDYIINENKIPIIEK